MKLIYICSPYRTKNAKQKKENISLAKYWTQKCLAKGHIPITPHLNYGSWLNDEIGEQRETAMKISQTLLKKCQEIWIIGQRITNGMKKEIKTAKQRKIKITHKK